MDHLRRIRLQGTWEPPTRELTGDPHPDRLDR